MPKRVWIALFVVFAVTRIGGMYLADHPEVYSGITFDTDVVYQGWADRVVHGNESPYSQVAIEYPPGSLPFILGIEHFKTDEQSYRTRFIVVMVLVDIVGLIGVIRIARRWNAFYGPWMWTALLPLLGPIVYTRLDLVPAVATVWAIERAAHGSWSGSGAVLGFGALAKIYPGAFLPAAWIIAKERKRFAIWAAALLLLPLLPLTGAFGELWDSVIGYHSERGIQVESLWGSALLIAMRRGYDVSLGLTFGALHFTGGATSELKALALALSAGALAFVTFRVSRLQRGDVQGLALGMFAIITLLLSVGTVFSAQFVTWVIALGAVVACVPEANVRTMSALLIVIAGLTQLIYPFMYDELLAAEPLPVALLWCRNLLVVQVALMAMMFLRAREVGVPGPDRAVATQHAS